MRTRLAELRAHRGASRGRARVRSVRHGGELPRHLRGFRQAVRSSLRLRTMALWDAVAEAAVARGGALIGSARAVPLASLAQASCLDGRLEALRGRSVVVAIRDQLTAAIALLELDGVARRMVLCTPDLA